MPIDVEHTRTRARWSLGVGCHNRNVLLSSEMLGRVGWSPVKIRQMLDERRSGGVYMNMAHPPSAKR